MTDAAEISIASSHEIRRDPKRIVEIPGEADAPLAAAGFVGWDPVFELRIIGGLQLPGDDAVLDEDLPAAATGAVDPVRRPDPLVVLEAVAVELLPLPLGRSHGLLEPGLHVLLLSRCTSERFDYQGAPTDCVHEEQNAVDAAAFVGAEPLATTF
jgi:hypothetical protein